LQYDLIKAIAESPTASFGVVGTMITLIFNAGVSWSNFRYLKRNAVTHKDLELALNKFALDISSSFVKCEICQQLRSSSPCLHIKK
jgi:hypothetical protein